MSDHVERIPACHQIVDNEVLDPELRVQQALKRKLTSTMPLSRRWFERSIFV